ncbi:Protein kinase domain - like 10, partial [Theobroma cacao]
YDKSIKGQDFAGDVTNIQSQAPLSKDLTSDVKLEPSKAEKQGKVPSSKGASAPRNRNWNYAPDLFFKVNGKLYQRLGKIGSGGSSEVHNHKVFSSDCTIYAIEKIKLKGRDYATAYGLENFRVIGVNLSNVGNIYISLLKQFAAKQILQAVNATHEERIAHSNLKPANFLLVKGSLKLTDFGIAKAIMSDTTNIQRDSRVLVAHCTLQLLIQSTTGNLGPLLM